MKLVFTIKKYRSAIILFLVFETIAVWLWQATRETCTRPSVSGKDFHLFLAFFGNNTYLCN